MTPCHRWHNLKHSNAMLPGMQWKTGGFQRDALSFRSDHPTHRGDAIDEFAQNQVLSLADKPNGGTFNEPTPNWRWNQSVFH